MPVTTSLAVVPNPKEVVSRSMGYRDIMLQVSVIQRFSSSDVDFQIAHPGVPVIVPKDYENR
jgi:hypothetical protein